MINMELKETGWKDSFALDRGKWWALVNTVTNLGVHLSNYQIPIKDSERLSCELTKYQVSLKFAI
jgi:hypothetical protein